MDKNEKNEVSKENSSELSDEKLEEIQGGSIPKPDITKSSAKLTINSTDKEVSPFFLF